MAAMPRRGEPPRKRGRPSKSEGSRSTPKKSKGCTASGCAVAPRGIHIFTDCSGIETPVMALEGLGLKYVHVGACEISLSLRKFIAKNFPPHKLYKERSLNEDCMACILPSPCTLFHLGATSSNLIYFDVFHEFVGESCSLWSLQTFVL